jgi:hypothetical protein
MKLLHGIAVGRQAGSEDRALFGRFLGWFPLPEKIASGVVQAPRGHPETDQVAG